LAERGKLSGARGDGVGEEEREAHAPLGSSMSFFVGNAMARRCRRRGIEEENDGNGKP